MTDEMNPGEIERRLCAARPDTAADGGWARSAAGDEVLDDIRHSAAAASAGARLRARLLIAGPHRSRRLVGYGLTAAAAVIALAVGLAATGPAGHGGPAGPTTDAPPLALTGPRPAEMDLAAYTDCDALLDGLRAHTANQVTGSGFSAPVGRGYATSTIADAGTTKLAPAPAPTPATAPDDTSTTNVQEAGVDEPDLVKTDGGRVVSVSGGVLRVIDAGSHAITGQLDLTTYAGAESAQLFVSGNRALVLLGSQYAPYNRGPMLPDVEYGYAPAASSTYLLVDLTHAPRVLATLHPKGGYVDARMVDGTVRLVVQSSPRITFPVLRPSPGSGQLEQNRAVVRHAPLSDWLPSYDVTTGGTTTARKVPCEQVRHPAAYTGTSMLTVYSIDLAAGLRDVAPMSITADGATVYSTTASLYVASSPIQHTGKATKTRLHRFDITRPGRPAYLGSGTVPGQLLNSYSLSDYAGHLRVVTTTGQYTGATSSSVYVLDAQTLKITGSVGGLGPRELVYAVRFIGPLAYVVTYRSVDPLYVLDLHDPQHPTKEGELTISGYSGYLHPVGPDTLLGVGQDADGNGIVTGLQVSLFDVARPAAPKRLARIVRSHAPGEGNIDPHAFLYWPATGTAVVPVQTWNYRSTGSVLVVHVGSHTLRTVGSVRNPSTTATEGSGIERSMVVDGALWTLSDSGIVVSDLTTLHRKAWIPFE